VPVTMLDIVADAIGRSILRAKAQLMNVAPIAAAQIETFDGPCRQSGRAAHGKDRSDRRPDAPSAASRIAPVAPHYGRESCLKAQLNLQDCGSAAQNSKIEYFKIFATPRFQGVSGFFTDDY
jgi:hypothetical protein